MLKEEYKIYQEKMKKSIESVISDFDAVRAGRANSAVLNRISVDYYGLIEIYSEPTEIFKLIFSHSIIGYIIQCSNSRLLY